MANRIITKHKSTTGAPSAGDLVEGELAINTFDQKLYSKDATTIFELTDHDALTNYIANEHIDWTNATDNFLTTGSVQGDQFRTHAGGIDIWGAASNSFIGFYDGSAYTTRQAFIASDDTAGMTIRNEVIGQQILIQGTVTGPAARNMILTDPDNVVQLYHAGTAKFATATKGARIFGDILAADPPTTEKVEAQLDFYDSDATTLVGQVGFLDTAGANDLFLYSHFHGGEVVLGGQDAAGAFRYLLRGRPDTVVGLYYDGTEVLRTQEFGLHIADGSINKDPFLAMYADTTYATRQGFVQFSDTLGSKVRNEVHGTTFELSGENAVGTVVQYLISDPDGGTALRGAADTSVQVAGGEFAFYGTANSFSTIYHNNVPAFRTHSGGFHVAAALNPFIGFYADTSFTTRTAFVQSTAISGYWRNERTSSNMNISSWNSADASVTHFDGDPDAGVTLYYQGSARLSTTVGGANLVGTLTANSATFEASSGNTSLNIQKAAATDQATVTYRNEVGTQRYIFGMAGVADHDFFIGKYNNAGTWTGSALYVDGVTGQVDLRWPTDQTKLSVIATGVDVTGALSATGAVTGSNLNVSDWDTAFGWGDHSLAGYTSNTGTVTNVNDGNGMTFTAITGSGDVTMGTPSSITDTSTNAVTTNSHTHAVSHTGTGIFAMQASPTFTGTVTLPATNMADADLNRPVLEDYAVKRQAPTVSANAVTVNCTLGNYATIDMDPATAAVTLTLSNPPASGRYGEVTLEIIMGTPAYGIIWPGSITWLNGGSAPVLTTTDNEVDFVHLLTRDGGTNWYGTYALAAGASGYTHPTHPGDDFSVDTGALTGATVVSDIDINVTTDTLGHVTDANGVVSTRTLSINDLGGPYNNYSHPTHPGDDFSVDTGALTGAVVVSDVDINVTTDTLGHVTDANGVVSTRTLSINDLGGPYSNNAGTVTAVNNGNGMNFTNITTSGTVTLGTPSSITDTSTNSTTASSHTHAVSHTGTGNFVMAASPTITGTLTAATITASGNINANGNIVGDGGTQITGIEQIVVDATADIRKTSHGCYLYHASTAYDNDQNGQVTFGTGAASGGTTGDIHFRYV